MKKEPKFTYKEVTEIINYCWRNYAPYRDIHGRQIIIKDSFMERLKKEFKSLYFSKIRIKK